MKAKVRKCHPLAIQASSGKVYDPGLMLQGEPIPSIGNNAVKFLGAYIQVPRDTQQGRQHFLSKLTSLLEKVDAVTRQQKLLLYKAAICPECCVTWVSLTCPQHGSTHAWRPLQPTLPEEVVGSSMLSGSHKALRAQEE